MRIFPTARLLTGLLLVFSPISVCLASTQAVLSEPATLQRWITQMKDAPRGPFQRLRWFCNDGTLQPPDPFACREHGGGVQHGEWTDRVKMLRAHGYLIANVLADIDAAKFVENPEAPAFLKQILLEQFLISADDGWIFRRARFYRGALQAEDEAAHGRDLLLALMQRPEWRDGNFAVLREAVRLIPHGLPGTPVSRMRHLSQLIAEKDPGFELLRIKLHVRPEPGDAAGVRDYARRLGRKELVSDYERLAQLIEEVNRPKTLLPALEKAAAGVADPALASLLRDMAFRLRSAEDPSNRGAAVARLMAVLRHRLGEAGDTEAMLGWVELSLEAEGELLRLGNDFEQRLETATRVQRLDWLQGSVTALYGMGLIADRQRQALLDSLQELVRDAPTAQLYRKDLDYLGRLSEWADRTLDYHFREEIERLARIEPLVRKYRHDRLRGSPLLSFSLVLDTLLRDAAAHLDFQHNILGESMAGGVRALNPGLSRGVLRLVRPGEKNPVFDRDGIYVLAETTPDLPPVTGILTAGPGNSLSHVQLLARNLGIPNAAIDHRLIPFLAAAEGRRVVLAVSPQGVVRLALDGPEWDPVFSSEDGEGVSRLRPDLAKLDLEERELLPLKHLRTEDAGRIVGPKAANLGELRRQFPEAVPEGLVIPFGVFRELIERTPAPDGGPLFAWLQREYPRIARIPDPAERQTALESFLEVLRRRIETAELGDEFLAELRRAMAEAFGPEGSYGVFVRSDTNVEDLPGFTGAGLNLTVPNVVGFDGVVQAIRRVWASPFTERAYRWRQEKMEYPEHVYCSVLLMRSVPAEKSGVMVTSEVATGHRDVLTVAANEGVGGAVAGQSAEELLVERKTGRVRLLASAAEPFQRILPASGGVAEAPASGDEEVLKPAEISRLLRLADEIDENFPLPTDAEGQSVPADVEFGFLEGRLFLFQVRPFLESPKARRSAYLNRLDRELRSTDSRPIDLDGIPQED